MAFKDVFDEVYLQRLGRQLEEVQVLEHQPFVDALVNELPSLEMKARSHRIAREIVAQSPLPYVELMARLVALLDVELPFEGGVSGVQGPAWRGFAIWPFTMIVAECGMGDWTTSFEAMNQFTRRFTAEFCIRPFLRNDPARVFEYLNQWVVDPSEHVRRLVSEGTRPFLPWGQGVPALSEYRISIVSLLERLKGDESEYVRRSVANHLNDLSRIEPDLVKDLCRRWLAEDRSHLPLIKRALRTLVKQGDPEALKLIGFGDVEAKCLLFGVRPAELVFPGTLEMHAELECDGDVLVDFTVEYASHSGKPSRKTFKWFMKKVQGSSVVKKTKTVQFKPISTRRFRLGTHRIFLHVNGKTLGEAEFQLVVN